MSLSRSGPDERDRPSAAELAAIVAAVEVAWPRPLPVAPEPSQPSPWRWSGRWWVPDRHVAASRRRP
jgi:hypothetical protein